MKNIKHIVFIAFVAIAAMACRKEDEPGGTAIEEMCGEWIVYDKTTGSSCKLWTTNTSDNDPTKIRISDGKTNASWFWQINFTANCDLGSKTFSANQALSQYWSGSAVYECNITVTDGQIIKDGVSGVFPSKTPSADKIVLKISFSDDATPYGTVYEMVGYRRTGFLEDESFVYTGE